MSEWDRKPSSEGAAADGSPAEPPLNVILSFAPEPSAVEASLPATQAVAMPAGSPGGAAEARREALPLPDKEINRQGRFPGRMIWLFVPGLTLLFLALFFSAWSTSAAGVIFPDWGLAALRMGVAAAILGTFVLVYLFIWRARVQPRPVFGGALGLLLVLAGVGGVLGAAPLHRLQGRWFEERGQYGLALASYQASGDSLAESEDMARISLEWAEQFSAQHDYGAAVAQIEPVARFYQGNAALVMRAQEDLVAAYLAWGDQAQAQGAFSDALAHYQALQRSAACDLGCQRQVHARLAQALLGLAQQLTAKQQYDEAVATYQQLVQGYSDTPGGREATLALTMPQSLTGQLVYADKTPAKRFQVLLASEWRFNATTHIFTLLGQQYHAQTDAIGFFVVPAVMVGMVYMIAWVDTGGHAGTCSTTTNQPLYTVQMQPLRATDVGSVNIECTE